MFLNTIVCLFFCICVNITQKEKRNIETDFVFFLMLFIEWNKTCQQITITYGAIDIYTYRAKCKTNKSTNFEPSFILSSE